MSVGSNLHDDMVRRENRPTYHSTFMCLEVAAFVVDPCLLELLICHKLNSIKRQVSKHERAIASKQALYSLSLCNGLQRIDCSFGELPCRKLN